MQDHIFFGPAYRVDVETFMRLANDPIYLVVQLANYAIAKTDPLTNPVADFLGWEKVPPQLRPSLSVQGNINLTKYRADWPELSISLVLATLVTDLACCLPVSAHPFLQTSIFTHLKPKPKDGYMYATILAALVIPQSRGNVTLNSADTNILANHQHRIPAITYRPEGCCRRLQAPETSFCKQIHAADCYW
jgi:choline dehydrogenase